jgi:hypothetical protein
MLVCLGLVILLTGCAQTTGVPIQSVEGTVTARVAATVAVQPKPAGSVVPARPPGAPRVPVTVDGALDSQTPPFQLDGGRYSVAWSVEPQPANGGCNGSLTLKSPDQPTFQQSIVSGLDAKIIATGTTQAYTVPAGSYYVAGISNCRTWTVTFTPA